MDVPQFDFATLDFTASMVANDEPTEPGVWGPLQWIWPSQPVVTIASAVLAQGQMLPIPPPMSNTSWTLDFWGPALHCVSVEGAQRDAVWISLWNSFENVSNSWPFLAWVPTNGRWEPPNEPLFPNRPPNEPNSPDLPTLYVATLPDMLKIAIRDGVIGVLPNETSAGTECEYSQVSTAQEFDETMACGSGGSVIRPSFAFEGGSLLQCDLFNASYFANFAYTNGFQNIQVSRNWTNASSPFSFPVEVSLMDLPIEDPTCSAYLQQDDDWESGRNFTVPCSVNATVLQQLSYQSIFYAFYQRVIGAARLSYDENYLELDTQTMSTVLAQTDELNSIRALCGAYGNSVAHRKPEDTNLQDVIRSSNRTAFSGLAHDVPTATRGSLKAALEEAFQNVTMSVLSDPYLQPNTSSQFAPSLSTNVTLETTVAFYVYDQTTLCIAYGLAILFSTLAVVVGLVFLVVSGTSYDTTFSTIVRVARAAHLNADLIGDEGAGFQPLPKRLANARLAVGSASPPLLAQVEMDDLGPQRQKLNVESNSLLAASEEGGVRNRGHQR
ncbi:hypothetical protein LTR56_024682 [Elasticomyces elasticus]|nr:hypothetical protein LTR56_024682 [Elasticomyces elasticus]KAK3622203.1 hypothetical protein LTR22_024905 [Elasticomyces elasticus]KAK4907808.1 hypothetical protein LTR49_023206 [Elasticomyces elasticus]KAK5747971.1 hypothetical protein LTS12_021967 [Elasticomyces elasticus]